MENITVKDLKQSMIDTIAKIDKEKVTILDLKTISETIAVIANIKDEPMDYMDVLCKMASTGFGRASTVYELEGED